MPGWLYHKKVESLKLIQGLLLLRLQEKKAVDARHAEAIATKERPDAIKFRFF
jgi:hypothetical protein